MEASSRAESFVNANGSDWSKSSAAVECLRALAIDGPLLVYARCGPDDFN